MKSKLSLIAALTVFTFVFTLTSLAADKKDKAKTVKLTGHIVCGKCTLGLTDACSNVLVVEKEGKKTNYFLMDKGRKAKYHGKICKPKSKLNVVVTGAVVKKGDRMYISKPKVKIVK